MYLQTRKRILKRDEVYKHIFEGRSLHTYGCVCKHKLFCFVRCKRAFAKEVTHPKSGYRNVP